MSTHAIPLARETPRLPKRAVNVEVSVCWGDTILKVAHLSCSEQFTVGQDPSCDLVLPAERMSAERATLVSVGGKGDVRVIVPEGVQAWVQEPGRADLIQILAKESSTQRDCRLQEGDVMRLGLGDLSIGISVGTALPRERGQGQLALSSWLVLSMLLSAVAHGWWLVWALAVVPPLGLTASEDSERETLFLLQHYLSASAQKERDWPLEAVLTDRFELEGGSGTRAKGEEGALGLSSAKDPRVRGYGVQGPRDNPDPHLAKQAALREAAEFGLIGLLNAGAGGDSYAPVAAWGRDESQGAHPVSAQGNLWGETIGDYFGGGGLGLTGIGEGGGGRGEGIGLGAIKTLGKGAGTGTGLGFGPGSHSLRGAQVRVGATVTSGRLPPEAIQRVVRANFGRYRFCYQNALRANPSLAGRVSVRFIIGRDGQVSAVQDSGSDLPDREVVGCVLRAFYGLSFPEPEGGIVTVVYPIVFAPS